MKAWEKRALDPRTPTTDDNETVRTGSSKHPKTGKEILYPTIRLIDGKLKKLSKKEARSHALIKEDFLQFDTPEEATKYSKNLSDRINKVRKEDMPGYKTPPPKRKSQRGYKKRLKSKGKVDMKKLLSKTKAGPDIKKQYGDWLED